MPPEVTIGIPMYNSASVIADTLRSVLAQTFRNWALLIIDDGSTDGSADLVRQIKDPRLTLLADGMNRGLVCRLNQMIGLTKTHYFARMDSDDLMHPERLERQLELFRRNPRLDITGTAVVVIDEDRTPYGIRGDSPEFKAAGIRAGFIHPTVLATTEWFRRHPYDPAFPRAEDMELWCRAGIETVCERLAEPLLFYRQPRYAECAKYRASCSTERRVLARYGPAQMGHLRTALSIARTYLKESIFLGSSLLGAGPYWIERRNRPCSPEERNAAVETIREILQVPLPSYADSLDQKVPRGVEHDH